MPPKDLIEVGWKRVIDLRVLKEGRFSLKRTGLLKQL